MDKIKVAKSIVNYVVGFGVGKIVYGIIKNNTDPEKLYDKIGIGAGTFVLGAMAKDATEPWTDAKIDSLYKTVTDIKNKLDGKPEESINTDSHIED